VWADEFAVAHDATGLASEANLLRRRPVDVVLLRVARGDEDAARIATIAASVAGVRLVISASDRQSDVDLAAVLSSLEGVVRLRLLTDADMNVHRVAFSAGIAVDTAPVARDPRIELNHWVIEQALARTMHRHGRLLRDEPI